jgi:hypothetical protein
VRCRDIALARKPRRTYTGGAARRWRASSVCARTSRVRTKSTRRRRRSQAPERRTRRDGAHGALPSCRCARARPCSRARAESTPSSETRASYRLRRRVLPGPGPGSRRPSSDTGALRERADVSYARSYSRSSPSRPYEPRRSGDGASTPHTDGEGDGAGAAAGKKPTPSVCGGAGARVEAHAAPALLAHRESRRGH